MSQSQLERAKILESLRDKALELIRIHHKNYSKVAALIGLDRSEFMGLRDKFKEDFERVESEVTDTLAELCFRDAQGKELPEGYDGFNFNKAMKLLERTKRAEWGNSIKVEKQPAKTPVSNGKVDELIEKYEQENVPKTTRTISSLPPPHYKQ